MLRITTHPTPTAVTLRLEGKLLADWCPELRDACLAAAATGLPLRLDLATLSFADADGITQIRHALSSGFTLGPCSSFVAALLATQPEIA